MTNMIKQKPNPLSLRKIPLGLSGVSLGIAGWGSACFNLGIPYVGDITSFITGCIIILFIFRKVLHFDVLIEEIKHPTLGSFLPTFTMASMIIATSITQINLTLGRFIWYCAIILHAIYLVVFFYYRVKDFDLKHMVPSWFVPPIGIVVACTTASNMNASTLAHGIFYFGFVIYLIMLPLMLNRLIFIKFDIDSHPIFGIMDAPANVCLAGYLISFSDPNRLVVGFLLTLGVLSTVMVYLALPTIFRCKFSPAFASLTFPLAVGTTAIYKASVYFGGTTTQFGTILNYAAKIELVIAGIIIFIVATKMVKFIIKNK